MSKIWRYLQHFVLTYFPTLQAEKGLSNKSMYSLLSMTLRGTSKKSKLDTNCPSDSERCIVRNIFTLRMQTHHQILQKSHKPLQNRNPSRKSKWNHWIKVRSRWSSARVAHCGTGPIDLVNCLYSEKIHEHPTENNFSESEHPCSNQTPISVNILAHTKSKTHLLTEPNQNLDDLEG